MLKRTIPFLIALAAAGCAHKKPPPPPPPAPPPPPPPPPITLKDIGLDPAALDRTADPCTDFYQYACGGWLKTTQIPPDKSRWSRSFNEIRERNRAELHAILEDAQHAEKPDELTQKIGNFYGSCMNEAAIEAAGTKPIEHLLEVAKAVKDRKSLLHAIFELHKYNITALFDIGSGQDAKDASKMILELDQAGLGLPDRDYYLSAGEKEKKIREAYLAHVQKMLTLAGLKESQAEKDAKEILKFETEIATISQDRVERRDPQKTYNPMELKVLKKDVPAFPWKDYLEMLGYPDITDLSINSIPFFKGVNKLLGTKNWPVWRAYLQWQVIHAMAPTLPSEFVAENFAFTKTLTGQEKIEDRWKRCVDATDAALGELLAQPFVARKFTPESKAAVQNMVKEIRDSFGRNLDKLDWMDDATRQKAKDKLAAVSFLIGYPDKWKEYNFTIDPKNYASNVLASRAYELKRSLGKIGKPVDRGEWEMTPPTVNAYYKPENNQMVFPAGILQPPFYDPKANIAVNMGAMGMVVGHELTHGFDDQGSQFDALGNLHDWWTPEVKQKFETKGQCIVDQYSKYEAVPGVFLNGKLTEGENIADNGGLKTAFHAYQHMREGAKDRIVAEGFTEDQQFFLAVGQVWCSLSRPEIAAMLAKVDPHSPPRFRVMGSISNTPEFGEAFNCKAGTPMRPANACSVW